MRNTLLKTSAAAIIACLALASSSQAFSEPLAVSSATVTPADSGAVGSERWRQGQVMTAYGALSYAAPICRSRSAEWSWKLSDKLHDVMPEGRYDLLVAFQIGRAQARELLPSYDEQYCLGVREQVASGDRVIEGKQSPYDPLQ